MSSDISQHSILIDNLKNGNEKAFATLVHTYHQLLCVFAFNLTRDREKAEDIVQNVFLKVWENRSRLKSDHSLKSYLHKLTYNEFIDHNRKQKSMSVLESAYAETLNRFIEQNDEDQLEYVFSKVKEEIENLSPQCKKVFTLSKQEGLTNAEIAEYLNVSKKAVEGHITKALSILRKKMRKKLKTILFLLYK